MQVKTPEASKSAGYASGNYYPWNQEWSEDNFLAIEYTNTGNYGSTNRQAFELPAEIVFGDDKPVTHSALEAYELVLKYAGASKKRDDADARIVLGIMEGSNRLIDSQDEVGGWPELKSLPAPPDSDRDGMADAWEEENGLNPSDPEDRNGDRDSDGFTNLEAYINTLAPYNSE
jgi:hypothetical protein